MSCFCRCHFPDNSIIFISFLSFLSEKVLHRDFVQLFLLPTLHDMQRGDILLPLGSPCCPSARGLFYTLTFPIFDVTFVSFEFISLVSFLNIVGCKDPSGLAEPVSNGWLSFGYFLALFSFFLPRC